MRSETLGGLEVRIAGGSDGHGGGDGPLVVLMHGFGAPGGDLVPLSQFLRLPAEVRFAFPAAPIVMSSLFSESRAWWMIDVEALERAMATGEHRDMSGGVPDGLPKARDAVTAMLGELFEALGAAPARTVLGGFSQGSMLACDVALRSDLPLAGLILLSCTLLCEHEWRAHAAARAGMRVIQSHGRSDALLSFAAAERLRDLLTGAGLDVEWHEFAGGHEIPPPILAAVGSFCQSVFAAV